MSTFTLILALLPVQADSIDDRALLELYRKFFFDGMVAPVTSVAFSPNGDFIAAASQNRILVWHIDENRLHQTFRDSMTDSNSVSFSRNGQYLSTGTSRQHVTVWAVNEPNRIYYPPVAELVRSRAVAFSPKTDFLAVGSEPLPHPMKVSLSDDYRQLGTIELWQTRDFARFLVKPNNHASDKISKIDEFRQFGELSQSRYPVSHLAFSGDGSKLLTTGGGFVCVFQIPDGALIDVLGPLPPSLEIAASVSHGGEAVAFSATTNKVSKPFLDVWKNVYLWDSKSKTSRGMVKLDSGLAALCFSPSRDFLTTAEVTGSLTVWDLQSMQPIVRSTGSTSRPRCLAISSDGNKIAVGTVKGEVIVFTLRVSEHPKTNKISQTANTHDPVWRRISSGHEHRTIAAALRSSGADVSILITSEGRGWLDFQAHGTAIDISKKLDRLAKFVHLRELNVSNFHPNVLEYIAQLKDLEVLRIIYVPTTAGLSALHSLQNLQILYLSSTSIRDDDLLIISRLNNLRILSLVGTGYTDAGLQHLCSLPNLSELVIDGSELTEAGIIRLAERAHLKRLEIKRTRISEQSAVRLRQLVPELQ